MYNIVPNRVIELTPMDIMTQTKTHHKISFVVMYGIALFFYQILNLQKERKSISVIVAHEQNNFGGFSYNNFSLVANTRNLDAGYISPQYHIVVDNLFQTVCGTRENEVVTDLICNQLFQQNRDFYVEEEFVKDSDLIYSPSPLDNVFLYEPECHYQNQELVHQQQITEERQHSKQMDKLPDHIGSTNPPPLLIPDDNDY